MVTEDTLVAHGAELTQLERQLWKVIAAAQAYIAFSSPDFRPGAKAHRVNLEDAIATAKAHLA